MDKGNERMNLRAKERGYEIEKLIMKYILKSSKVLAKKSKWKKTKKKMKAA